MNYKETQRMAAAVRVVRAATKLSIVDHDPENEFATVGYDALIKLFDAVQAWRTLNLKPKGGRK